MAHPTCVQGEGEPQAGAKCTGQPEAHAVLDHLRPFRVALTRCAKSWAVPARSTTTASHRRRPPPSTRPNRPPPRTSPAKLRPAPTIGTASISRRDPNLTRAEAAAAATHRAKIPPTASHHDSDKAEPRTSPSPMAALTIRLTTRLRRVPDTPTAAAARTPIASARPCDGFCVVARTAGIEHSAPNSAERPTPRHGARRRRRADHVMRGHRPSIRRVSRRRAGASRSGDADPEWGAAVRPRAPARRAASAPASAARGPRARRHRRPGGPA